MPYFPRSPRANKGGANHLQEKKATYAIIIPSTDFYSWPLSELGANHLQENKAIYALIHSIDWLLFLTT